MSIPAGPTFDAFSSTIEASNPFTSFDTPIPLLFVVARAIFQYRTNWNILRTTAIPSFRVLLLS